MRRALCFLLLLALPSVANAHGRPPFLGDLAFHPTDPNLIVARATFGLVISEDNGENWRWLCAAVTGADPTREDPPIVIVPDRSVLVGTFGGLARSTPEHCAFTFPEALRNRFVIDIETEAQNPENVWAVATSGSEPDVIFRSTDQGLTFTEVGSPVEDVLIERVRVAPSDPSRVYLSGAVPVRAIMYDGGAPDGGPTTTERMAFILRSTDGGASYERFALPFVEEERNAHLLAVDPTDPDRVLLRMTRRSIDTRPERVLLSEDGGETWTEVAAARQVSGAAFSDDGARAWVTSRVLDGILRSDDGALTFSSASLGTLPCLAVRGDGPDQEVWTCVDELVDGYAVGRSTDLGDSFDEVLHFNEIYELAECSECTPVGHVCPEWFPDVAYDLRLDAGTSEGIDGAVSGGPRDAGPMPEVCDVDGGAVGMDAGVDAGAPEPPPEGCGCAAVGSSAALPPWLTLLGLVALRRRRG